MDTTWFVLSGARTGSYYASNLLDLYYCSKRQINRKPQPLTEVGRGAEYHLPFNISNEQYRSSYWNCPETLRRMPRSEMIPFEYDTDTKLIVRRGEPVEDNRLIYSTTTMSIGSAYDDGALSSYKIMIPYVNHDLMVSLKDELGIKFVTIKRDPYDSLLSVILAQSNKSYYPVTTNNQINVPQLHDVSDHFIVNSIKRINGVTEYSKMYADAVIDYNDLISDPCTIYKVTNLHDYKEYVSSIDVDTKQRYTDNKEKYITDIDRVKELWNKYGIR